MLAKPPRPVTLSLRIWGTPYIVKGATWLWEKIPDDVKNAPGRVKDGLVEIIEGLGK